jgi:hypothetical protein
MVANDIFLLTPTSLCHLWATRSWHLTWLPMAEQGASGEVLLLQQHEFVSRKDVSREARQRKWGWDPQFNTVQIRSRVQTSLVTHTVFFFLERSDTINTVWVRIWPTFFLFPEFYLWLFWLGWRSCQTHYFLWQQTKKHGYKETDAWWMELLIITFAMPPLSNSQLLSQN